MKVSELMRLLSRMDPDRVVVLQKDAEGNGYELLRGADANARFDEDEETVGRESLSEKDRAAGYSDEDIMTDGAPACVLFP